MDGNLSLILAFLVSISVVLALVIKFKLHPFLSLFIGCLLMGVCSGLDPMAIIKTSCKGFGDTMGDIGIIILLGVAMGQILHESGCTREIANTMLRLCGREKSALALNLTGYIISIPVFFDAAFVILIGLIREMAREGKLALNTLVTALVVGLTCTHALVIPTPGPVAVAGNMARTSAGSSSTACSSPCPPRSSAACCTASSSAGSPPFSSRTRSPTPPLWSRPSPSPTTPAARSASPSSSCPSC